METKPNIGWHDSRVIYPKNEIQVYNDLYVIDTKRCLTVEVKALLFNRTTKELKTPYEMMTYLSKKEPRYESIWNIETDETFYTPAFGSFIVSTSPKNIIALPEKDLATKVAEEFHDTMKELLKDEKLVYKHMLKNMIKGK